jgi:hypothetical protein
MHTLGIEYEDTDPMMPYSPMPMKVEMYFISILSDVPDSSMILEFNEEHSRNDCQEVVNRNSSPTTL